MRWKEKIRSCALGSNTINHFLLKKGRNVDRIYMKTRGGKKMSGENVREISCPKCGTSMVKTEDYGVFHCSYCGTNIQFVDMIEHDQKSKILRSRFSHQELMKDKEYENQIKRMKYESRSERRQFIQKILTANDGTGLIILLFMVIIGSCIVFAMISGDPYKEEKEALKTIESEVVEHIQAEEYDTALAKANQLRYSGDKESETYKTWEDKRKEYISIINASKEEADVKNPDNIFMPGDAGSYRGKNYSEIAEYLRTLGFTNVSACKSIHKADLFHGRDTVESIIIDGKTEFKKGDYFLKDAAVILYYYQ